MANFQTHLTGGTVVSALAASSILSLQLIKPAETAVLFLLGMLGSLLPDIDSDDSTSLRLLFNLFGLIAALCMGSWLHSYLSLSGLWLVAGGAFALVRFALMPVFEYFSVHRGSLHSLLACLMFSLIAVHLALLADKNSIFAFCAGGFILLGMLTHLTLDEFYSVDLNNMEVKRSFGSALKPLAPSYPFTTAAHVIVCAVLIYFTPSTVPLINALSASDIRFLPWQDWQNLLSSVAVLLPNNK